MDRDAKLLVVLGATGAQGESVVRHFIEKRKDFQVRGITRNPDSVRSQALSATGVDMVKADLNDDVSLRHAFDGATHIFANIDSVEPIMEGMQNPEVLRPGQNPFERGAELEKAMGRDLIDAAAALPSLRRIIWSTLPGVSKTSKGKYTKVTQFDAKEVVAEMFAANEDLRSKVSLLYVGLYFDMPLRIPMLYPIRKDDDGTYELSLALKGDERIAFANVGQDMGGWVASLIEAPPGTNLIGCSEMLSWEQWLQAWAAHNSVRARFAQSSVERHMALMGGAGAVTLEAMQFVVEYGMAGGDPDAVLPEDIGAPTSSVAMAMAQVDWAGIL